MQKNIEDLFAQRLNEMNQFYQQLNLTLPMQQNLQLLQNITANTHSQSHFHLQQSIQIQPQSNGHSASQQSDQTTQVHENIQSKPQNNYDEMPVKGQGRNFEEILQEQLGTSSPQIKKKNKTVDHEHHSYLKKGTRKFLSHAQPKEKEDQSPQQSNRSPKESPNVSPKSLPQSSSKKRMQNKSSPPDQSLFELKQQIEKELQRQKTLTQSCRQKQKKLEAQTAQLKHERDAFQEEVQKFQLQKIQIIEDEKKKFRREMKTLEHKLKSTTESQIDQDKDEISKLRQQIKSLNEFHQMSENNHHQQLQKLRSQVEQLQVTMKEQEQKHATAIEEYQDRIRMLEEVIQNYRNQEQVAYKSIESDKSQKRTHALSTGKKPQSQQPQQQLQETSKSAKQFKSYHASEQAKITVMDLVDADLNIEDFGKKIDENQFNYDQNPRYKTYLKEKEIKSKIDTKYVDPDGKTHITYKNGKTEIILTSGIQKEIFKDGYTVVSFKNNDVKQVFPNGVVIYYFYDANATQTTFPNGQNVYKFYNKQIELHHPDGSKDIRYQSGIIKSIDSKGNEKVLPKHRVNKK